MNEEVARLTAIFESAPTAMVMIDAAGRIVLINGYTEKLFGYPRREHEALATDAGLLARVIPFSRVRSPQRRPVRKFSEPLACRPIHENTSRTGASH